MTGMTIGIVCRQARLRSTISSREMKTRPTKGQPIPTVRAVPVADVVDEVAEQLGIARLTKRHRPRRTRDLRTSRCPMTTMASARVWPRRDAARIAACRSNDRQRIVGVRIEAVPIEVTDLLAPTALRETRPAEPRHVLAGTETKAPTAQPNLPVRSGVRATQWTGPRIGPPVGMKVAGISQLASPPVGVAMRKPRLPARIGEVAMTDLHAMTVVAGMIAPRIGNPRTGVAMKSMPGPLVELLRVLIVAVLNVMTDRPVGSRPNGVARANRRGPRVQTLLARTAVTAIEMTGPPVEIAMIALPAVTRLLVQIVRRETARVVRNRARLPRPVATGTRKTSNPRNENRLAPSRRRSTPRLGNTPSRC